MIVIRTLLLSAAASLVVAVPAQEPVPATPAKPPVEAAPAPKKSVEQLIEALGSDSYRARLDAERSLREAGQEAVPLLKKAADTSDDAEVQWRARRVLRQIERGGAAGLEARQRGAETPDLDVPQGGEAPREQRGPSVLRRRGAEGDPMRDHFESLFERLQQDFGIDIPRARFFDDSFFRDLQEQMKAGTSRSQGLSMQIGPDGAVRVEVQEKGDDGKTDTKVYEAPDMESFHEKHPGVLQKNGLGMGLLPGGPLRGFAPRLEFDRGGGMPPVWTLPKGGPGQLQVPGRDDLVVEPPPPPPAGKRLGIAIRNEIPADLRDYLGLDEGVGLMVESVSDGSLAQALGLQKGDIVTHIGEHTIGSPQDVQDALGPIAKGSPVEVRFVRKGESKTAKADKAEATAAEAPKAERLQRRKAKTDETIR